MQSNIHTFAPGTNLRIWEAAVTHRDPTSGHHLYLLHDRAASLWAWGCCSSCCCCCCKHCHLSCHHPRIRPQRASLSDPYRPAQAPWLPRLGSWKALSFVSNPTSSYLNYLPAGSVPVWYFQPQVFHISRSSCGITRLPYSCGVCH